MTTLSHMEKSVLHTPSASLKKIEVSLKCVLNLIVGQKTQRNLNCWAKDLEKSFISICLT